MDWTDPKSYRKRPRLRLAAAREPEAVLRKAPRPKAKRKANTRALRKPRSIAFTLALLGMISAGAAIGLGLPSSVEELKMPSWFGSYSLCHTGGGRNCVVDGDTFYHNGEKIRIADIDAPETHPPRCAREEKLGDAATIRLQALLNAGPITLSASEDRDRDKYGRLLRTVERDGESLGGMLVDEGLARWYGNGRRSWCSSE